MLMVLAVHLDGASLGLPDFAAGKAPLDARTLWQTVVESTAIIGVNSFTLISGWFGIRFKLRGVCSYLFQCLFYAVVVATVALAAGWIGWGQWWERWLILTHTDLWYVPAYFSLMLLAPFVNAGFERMSRRQATLLTILFLLFNVWGGWWWGGRFNPNGYTVMQLLLVYMIGRWLALHGAAIAGLGRPSACGLGTVLRMWRSRGWRPSACGLGTVLRWCRSGGWRLWLMVYAGATALIMGCAWLLPPVKAYAYNSPAVLLSTVALFMVFRNLEIRSRWINRMSESAFAVYLLHKSPEGWLRLMRPLTAWCWKALPLWGFTLYALLFMAAVYALAMLIDPLRRRLWHKFLACVQFFTRVQ